MPALFAAAPETGRFAAGMQVAVLLPLPVETAYDYLVPDGEVLAAGDIVEVPLGRRFEVGVVWGPGAGDVPTAKLREVVHKLDLPPLPPVLRHRPPVRRSWRQFGPRLELHKAGTRASPSRKVLPF